MAFEVARVHGIIRSNIREDGSSKASPMPGSVIIQECPVNVQTQQTGARWSCPPSDMSLAGPASWSDVACSSLASSPHSTETENDEDDNLLAGLAQHVAQTMLNDHDRVTRSTRGVDGKRHAEAPNISCIEANKAAESPSSSCSSGSWSSGHWPSASSTGSSKGSSRMSSQVSSPPTTPVQAKRSDAWDLLHAAAGEVVRLKMHQQKNPMSSSPTNRYQKHYVQSQPLQSHLQVPGAQIQTPGRIVVAHAPPMTGSLQAATILPYSRNWAPIHGSAYQQGWNSAARGEDCQHYSNHQQMAMEVGRPGAVLGFQARSYPVLHHQQSCRPVLPKSYQGPCRSERLVDYGTPPQWTAAAQQGGLGMRAVFLGSGASQQKSSGTGVFLPRNAGNSPEPKRKPACSTVLLPSRIVQVLNLNVENMCSHLSLPTSFAHSPSYSDHPTSMPPSPNLSCNLGVPAMGCSKPSFEEGWLGSCGTGCPQPILCQTSRPELCLPSEWTY